MNVLPPAVQTILMPVVPALESLTAGQSQKRRINCVAGSTDTENMWNRGRVTAIPASQLEVKLAVGDDMY